MSALFMIKKSIPYIVFSLASANKKLFSKNLFLLFLSNTKKVEITILLISRLVLSIFGAPKLVFCILKPSWKAKTGFIILTLLFKSNKALV